MSDRDEQARERTMRDATNTKAQDNERTISTGSGSRGGYGDARLSYAMILRNTPRSPRRTLALQHLINARMDANCAISFGGRF